MINSTWNVKLRRRITFVKIEKILQRSETSMIIKGKEFGISEEKTHYLRSSDFPKEIWDGIREGSVISLLIQEHVEKVIFPSESKNKEATESATILTADYSWICHDCCTRGPYEGEAEDTGIILNEIYKAHDNLSPGCKRNNFVILYKGVKQEELSKTSKYKTVKSSS